MTAGETRRKRGGLCRTAALAAIFLSLSKPVHSGWVDPDTPPAERLTQALTAGDNRQFGLVFSDEFEQDGRTFDDGNDPRWTALNKNDYTNQALHFYSPKNAITTNGVLNLTASLHLNKFKAYKKNGQVYVGKKHIQSAMIQGWNKFCFTGGIVEFSAKLPGSAHTGGLWPALWLLGNLARATYVRSTNHMWPFSYNHCDKSAFNTQEINKCLKVTHYGMVPGVGRGAPEIDILEAMQGGPGKLPHTNIQHPYISTSLQVAPGKAGARPVAGQLPLKNEWYTGLEFGNATNSSLNNFFYGATMVQNPVQYSYQSDAISANMHLSESYYNSQHIYRVEWEPPFANGTGGYVRWFVDGKFAFGIKAESLNLTQTQIPSEPMYMIMNTAVSKTWGFPACPSYCKCKCFECGNANCECGLPSGFCQNFPNHFEIDYVRVYQAFNSSSQSLGCSTKDRPTKRFIEAHRMRYMTSAQTSPLLPIKVGGASCRATSECGGPSRGTCAYGTCKCMPGFTGPSCLAHDGFYNMMPPPQILPVNSMVVPKGLLIIFILFVGGFIFALRTIIRQERKQGKFNRAAVNRTNEVGESGFSSYQNATDKKQVTYLVVDGRLID